MLRDVLAASDGSHIGVVARTGMLPMLFAFVIPEAVNSQFAAQQVTCLLFCGSARITHMDRCRDMIVTALLNGTVAHVSTCMTLYIAMCFQQRRRTLSHQPSCCACQALHLMQQGTSLFDHVEYVQQLLICTPTQHY